MISVHNLVWRVLPSQVVKGVYKVDDKSTMGRLIKQLLDKGHYGQPYMEEPFEYVHVEADSETLDQRILLQCRELEKQGREPRKVLVGTKELVEFENYLYATSGFYKVRLGETVEDKKAPGGYRVRNYIMGLPVSILPNFEGVLVLDDLMLEL